jgi:hypothetical protein
MFNNEMFSVDIIRNNILREAVIDGIFELIEIALLPLMFATQMLSQVRHTNASKRTVR